MKVSIKNAILNTVAASGANVYDDAVGKQIGVIKEGKTGDTIKPLVSGPFKYGTVSNLVVQASSAEATAIALIGASETKETIIAGKRYSFEVIEENENGYRQIPRRDTIAYTAPAVLSGTADTDRANVYTVFKNKINNYAGYNFVGSTLVKLDYTLGSSPGDTNTNYVVGETVTQETSGVTAKIAKSTIKTGTFAADNATGVLWLYDVSNIDAFTTTAKKLTAADKSNCFATITNATVVKNTGLAIIDKPGYNLSSPNRGGGSSVYLKDGFAVDAVENIRQAAFPVGIGSYLAAKAPSFNKAKNDLVNDGDINLFLPEGSFDASKKYSTYSFVVTTSSEDVNGVADSIPVNYTLWVDESDATNLGAFKTALDTAIAK